MFQRIRDLFQKSPESGAQKPGKVKLTLREAGGRVRAWLRKPETRKTARQIVREVARKTLPGPEKMEVAAKLLIEALDRFIEPGDPLTEAITDTAIRESVHLMLEVYLEEVYEAVHRDDNAGSLGDLPGPA